MKNIILLNGSPRVNNSTSMKFLLMLKEKLGNNFNGSIIEASKSLLHKKQLNDYEMMSKADAIVIAFPLYVYCMPGALTEFLQGYQKYISDINNSNSHKIAGQKVYAIINCGFPESYICNEAALVIKCFCKEINASYRMSILIGSGGMLQPMKFMPSVKRMWQSLSNSFDIIIKDIQTSGNVADININSKIPKKLFYFIGQTYFSVIAKKDKINRKQIRRKPYKE